MRQKKRPTPRRTWQPLQQVVAARVPPDELERRVMAYAQAGHDPSLARRGLAADNESPMWKNARYTVIVNDLPSGVTWLSVRRNDRKPIRDWRDMQMIKNELCGPEREGVELYPAESRLVDTANQFHLWVAPAGAVFPIGFHNGRHVDDGTLSAKVGAVQRQQERTRK